MIVRRLSLTREALTHCGASCVFCWNCFCAHFFQGRRQPGLDEGEWKFTILMGNVPAKVTATQVFSVVCALLDNFPRKHECSSIFTVFGVHGLRFVLKTLVHTETVMTCFSLGLRNLDFAKLWEKGKRKKKNPPCQEPVFCSWRWF